VHPYAVIPAQAGIHQGANACGSVDSRLRLRRSLSGATPQAAPKGGNDGEEFLTALATNGARQ